MFVTAFVIGMQITNINEILRDGRDRTRVSAINHLGKVLYKYDSELKVGKNNSNTGSIKIDEGYVRLANHLGDQQKELRILFVDPINNEEFNIEFSALNQSDFIINAKLESDRYKDNFGEFYTFECINKKCSSISVLDKLF